MVGKGNGVAIGLGILYLFKYHRTLFFPASHCSRLAHERNSFTTRVGVWYTYKADCIDDMLLSIIITLSI